MNDASTTRIIGRPRLAGVWLTLTFEALVLAFWKPVAWVAAGVGFALLDLPEFIPFWAHWALLTLFAAVFVWAAIRSIRHIRLPDRQALLRRLELVNGLKHRPLRSLEDSFSQSQQDRQAAELWYLHQNALRRSLGRLKIGLPQSALAQADPYALRFVALLLLLIGGAVAGPDWQGRLVAAVTPVDGSNGTGVRVTVDAWINPPEYTRMVPVVLAGDGRRQATSPSEEEEISDLARRQSDRIAVPVGSKLTIRVNNAEGQAVFIAPGGRRETPLIEDGAGYFGLETQVGVDGAHHVLVDGDREAQWDFALIPDHPPEVSFKGEPTESQRHSLSVPYLAQDDYGVERLYFSLRLAGDTSASSQARIDSFSIPVAVRQRNVLDNSHYFDLTAHPWAGLQVMAWMTAEDAIGQKADSQPIAIVLPQRVFEHPVARAIIRERRRLAAQGAGAAIDVARNLHLIAWNGAAYNHNSLVFLALSVAKERLQHREVATELESTMKILWDTALRLEDGEVSLAAQELQALQQELMEAMARGADQEELAGLMDQLEQAMAKYLEALQDQAMQRQQDGEPMPEQRLSEMMSGQSLQDIMEQIRDLMRMGMMDEAQQLLSQLQQMMQNLQVVEQQFPPEGREALEMLRDMQQMMGQQQDIMERSHDRAMGRDGEESDAAANRNRRNSEMNDAGMQEDLRQRLKELGQRFGDMMGDTPGAFNDADQSMQDAAQSLAQGRNHRATQSQGSALDSMQEASRAMQEAIIERFMGQGNMEQPVQGVSSGDGRDPFGRLPNPGNRGSGRGDQDVPTQNDVDRARQIQEELRRRSGDQERPPVELDYIERLLNPF